MDSTTVLLLANSVVTFLNPYLIKAGEKFAEEIGESAYNGLKNLFVKVRKQFLKKKENDVLSEFVSNPSDLELKQKIIDRLCQQMLSDENYAKELQTSVSFLSQQNKFINYFSIENKVVALNGGVASGKGGVSVKGNVTGDIKINNS